MLFYLFLYDVRKQVCVFKTSPNVCGDFRPTIFFKDLSKINESNLDIFLKEQIEDEISITGSFLNSIRIKASDNINKMYHFSFWNSVFDSVLFENISIQFNSINANKLFLNNATVNYDNTEIQSILKAKTLVMNNSFVNFDYIECSNGIVIKNINENIQKIFKIASPTLIFDNIEKELLFEQKGNVLEIIENQKVLLSVMLLGYKKSRVTTLFINSFHKCMFSSLFSHAECAFKNVILPNTKEIVLLESYWSPYEYFHLGKKGAYITCNNFDGCISIDADNIVLTGLGKVKVDFVRSKQNTSVCGDLVLKISEATNSSFTTYNNSSIIIDRVFGHVFVDGSCNIPTFIEKYGSFTAKEAFGKKCNLIYPLSNCPLTIQKFLNDSMKVNILNTENERIEQNKVFSIIKCCTECNFNIKIKSSFINGNPVYDILFDKNEGIHKVSVHKVIPLTVSINDVLESETKFIKNAEITFDQDYVIDFLFDTKSVITFSSQNKVNVIVKENSCKTIEKLILNKKITLNAEYPLRFISLQRYKSTNLSSFNAKKLELEKQGEIFFGNTQTFLLNENTEEIVIKGASYIEFTGETFKKMKYTIDVTCDCELYGEYNSPNIILTIFSTIDDEVTLTVGNYLPGTVYGSSNLIIKSEDRILNVTSNLYNTFNFEMPKRGLIVTSGEISKFKFQNFTNTYVIPTHLQANNLQHFTRLAVADSVKFSESSFLYIERMTIIREETTFIIPKSFDNLPFIRCNVYENADKIKLNKYLGMNRFQEKIRFIFSKSSNEKNLLNKTGSIPIACFDQGFECSNIPNYYSVIDGSDAYISCLDYGRVGEKCIFMNYGPNPDPGDGLPILTEDNFPIIGIIVIAFIYLVSSLYFVVARTCFSSNIFNSSCYEYIIEHSSYYFFIKYFSFICNNHAINLLKSIFTQISSIFGRICICNVCEETKSIDESIDKIAFYSSTICIEDHLFKGVESNIVTTRKRTLLNNKLKKEMICLERNISRSKLSIPKINNNFIVQSKLNQQESANDIAKFARRINSALGYIKNANISIDSIIPYCYNTITLYTNEENIIIPIDGKPTISSKIFDEYLSDYSLFELKIIVQLLFGIKTQLDGESLMRINTEECNWDYGDELDFKRTMICNRTCRTMLSDPFTGEISQSGFPSNKLNCHEMFIIWMKHLSKKGFGNRFIDNYFNDRHGFVLFIFHYIVPSIKPTLPIGILELVDMTLADYERTPNMSTIRVNEFIQISSSNLHVFYSLEEEKLFRESFRLMYGKKLYKLFLVMDEYVKRNPRNLDSLILTSFDYIEVIQELAETRSRFLPIIYMPSSINNDNKKAIKKMLKTLSPNSSRQALTDNYEKLPDEWNRASLIKKKIVALSFLTGVFIREEYFYNIDYYYTFKENMIIPHSLEEKMIQNNIINGNYNYLLYDCNSFIDYLFYRSAVPTSDQLIGFFFNHTVPNKKLFLPASIGTTFKAIVKGFRTVLKTTSIVEILNKAKNEKGKEGVLTEGKITTNSKFSDTLIRNAREAVPSLNIKASFIIERSYKCEAPPRCNNKMLKKLCKYALSLEDQIPRILRLAFNVIEIGNILMDGNFVEVVIPVAGHPDWNKRDKMLIELAKEYHNNKKALKQINKLISIYYRDLQIALLMAFYKLSIESAKITIKKSENAVPLAVKNISVCPATLHPFMYERKTLCQKEDASKNIYNNIKIFKYLKEYISNVDDEYNYIPTPEIFVKEIFDIRMNEFTTGSSDIFIMLPPNIIDVCKALCNEYNYVVSYYKIQRSQFLLIYEVCKNKELRSQYELRFLKMEVADLVEMPISENIDSNPRRTHSKDALKIMEMKKKNSTSNLDDKQLPNTAETKKPSSNNNILSKSVKFIDCNNESNGKNTGDSLKRLFIKDSEHNTLKPKMEIYVCIPNNYRSIVINNPFD